MITDKAGPRSIERPPFAPGSSRFVCAVSPSLASKIAADIAKRLQGRGTAIGLNLTDSTDNKTGVTCWYQSTKHFYAASVIKVTILGALLRKTQEQNRQLAASEKHEAWLMITQSDNNAANALWADVGYKFMHTSSTWPECGRPTSTHAGG